MPDGRPDRRTNLAGHTQEILIRVPKNTQGEVVVAKKTSVTRGSKVDAEFIDFRFWFYKGGDTSKEPRPTKKGVQLPRRHFGRVALAVLRDFEPGELTPDRIRDLRAELDRLADDKVWYSLDDNGEIL